ncbi:MAG: hypothetical protein JXR91_10940 [Deltaproteobacteria bacterium]|nr:hypothetical protein [Deltaproteobacteria bacterium]
MKKYIFVNILIYFFLILSLFLNTSCTDAVVGASCEKGLSHCEHGCFDLNSDISNCGSCNTNCLQSESCFDGFCGLCPKGESMCNNSCTDTLTDTNNCGECGTICNPGETCTEGVCKDFCDFPLVNCNGICTDLNSSSSNCGSCNNVCDRKTPACVNRICTDSCPEWMDYCDESCVWLQNNPDNCGGCNIECPNERPFCDKGECTLSCSENLVECNGSCTDIKSDRTNCGKCNNICDSDKICGDGVCSILCSDPKTICGGSCVDLNTSELHCNACGNSCNSGELCISGSCTIVCGANKILCKEECVNYTSDRFNCGGCNIECTDDEVCSGGKCVPDCGQLTFCAESCVDTGSDVLHCGKCDTPCQSGYFCVSGECKKYCPPPLVQCNESCVDNDTNPFNCGDCGTVCDTGICQSGECKIEKPGHIIVIGHDYTETHTVLNRIIANSVFISPAAPVKIIAYTEFADTSNGGLVEKVNNALDIEASNSGLTLSRDFIDTATDLSGIILNYDVLMIYTQKYGLDTDLWAVGNLWFSPLKDFLALGGIVVLIEGPGLNTGTCQILSGASLFSATGTYDCSGNTIDVVEPGDAVAQGVSKYYLAPLNSTCFETTEEKKVAEDTTANGTPLIHRIVLP